VKKKSVSGPRRKGISGGGGGKKRALIRKEEKRVEWSSGDKAREPMWGGGKKPISFGKGGKRSKISLRGGSGEQRKQF